MFCSRSAPGEHGHAGQNHRRVSGKITATQKAVVQVSIDKDENEEAGVRWLPYATVYSTPDGTGWYCMPEGGDSIRLYAPNEHDVLVL